MKHSVELIFKLVRIVLKIVIDDPRPLKSKIAVLLKSARKGAGVSYNNLLNFIEKSGLTDDQKRKLRIKTIGLHEYLQKRCPFKFSLLLIIEEVELGSVGPTFVSMLEQTAPDFEILIGIKNETNQINNREQIERYREKVNDTKAIVRVVNCQNQGIMDLIYNSSGDYLLIIENLESLRSDLLFRYHQTLFESQAPSKMVLYCNDFQIDKYGYPIDGTYNEKPLRPEFPFVFSNWFERIACFSTKTLKALQVEKQPRSRLALCYRLYELGFEFLNIPIFLCSYASKVNALHTSSILIDLTDFSVSQGGRWQVLPINSVEMFRIEHKNLEKISIHVIVPFKNEKEITVKCVKSVLSQVSVNIFITAVDNGSSDLSIGEELRGMDIEVLRMDVPFNYSYLNNQALRESKCPSNYSLVLFLNNDVLLDNLALYEMANWAQEPQVGAVGCLLTYPDGTVQHGGVSFSTKDEHHRIPWVHNGHGSRNLSLGIHSQIYTPDCVTGACMMMRKAVFKEAGEFDEILYPISYSDTNLCMKIRNKGFSILYTPYARGIHFESKSRGRNHIEDYESSSWLHARYFTSVTRMKKGRATSHSQLWM